MTKKSLKIALVALVMMPMMALTMNGQTAAERNAAEKGPVISVDKRLYSVGDKITVKVSEITRDATITVWYNVIENEREEGKPENRKEMRKTSESEHSLTVDKEWAGKWIKIVAENTKEKVFSNEIIVPITSQDPASRRTGAEATDVKFEEDKKDDPRSSNQPTESPATPTPTPKPAPTPTPRTTDNPSTTR